MRWYAVLFWIWVIGSLGLFVWRRVNGAGRTDEPDDERPSAALTKQWDPPPPDPDAPLASSDDVTSSTPPTSAAPPRAADTASMPPRPVTSSGPPSLADLLQGIALPCDLVPLTQSISTTGPITELVAGTTSASAEEVGRALADEVERLGYTVTSTGDRTARAEGPRGAVEIEIHPNAGSAADGGELKFPTAESGTVIVELRASSGPRLS